MKRPECFLVRHRLAVDQFDGHRRLQHQVIRSPDGAHATRAQPFVQPVATDEHAIAKQGRVNH